MLVMQELYPSAEALDEALRSGASGVDESGMEETFGQLEALLRAASSAR